MQSIGAIRFRNHEATRHQSRPNRLVTFPSNAYTHMKTTGRLPTGTHFHLIGDETPRGWKRCPDKPIKIALSGPVVPGVLGEAELVSILLTDPVGLGYAMPRFGELARYKRAV